MNGRHTLGTVVTGALILSGAGVAVAGPAVADVGTRTFATGTDTWTVPPGVHSATFRLLGGSGGAGDGEGPSGSGGRDAILEATLAVTPGDTYTITVGGQGASGAAGGAGGTNGGGAGGPGWVSDFETGHGGGGGGATDVRHGGTGLADRILVAGGGGGDSGPGRPVNVHPAQPGGPGGGVTGASSGSRDPGGGGFGWAGTATGGGAAGLLPGHDGTAGTAGTGGDGGAGGPGGGGGGGGGGWYGGGGGSGSDNGGVAGAGGGGGSGYAVASATGVKLSRPTSGGDGQASVFYAVPQESAPTISGTPPVAIVGEPYDFTFDLTGLPDPSLHVDGMPPGLTVDQSGHVTGTPTSSGDFGITLTAANSNGSVSLFVWFRIRELPTLDATQPTNGTVGVAYGSWSFHPGGYEFPDCSLTGGSLPAGLTFDVDNCALTGTPTEPGTFPFTLTADNHTRPAVVDYTVTIDAVPTIGGTFPTATVGGFYSRSFDVTGSVTCAVVDGGLPPGLDLDASSCTISGTPTTPGSYGFTVRATGAGAAPETQASIDVVQVPTVGGIPPNQLVGHPYSYSFPVTGAPTPRCSVSDGRLPTGLALDAATCSLSGTPTAAGSYTFTLTADNGLASTFLAPYTVVIGTAPAFSGTPTPARVGQPYSFTFTTTGSPQPTVLLGAGELPPGLTLGADGTLAGLPTRAGTFSLTIVAFNTFGYSPSRAVSVTVADGPSGQPVVTTPPPAGPGPSPRVTVADNSRAEGNSGTQAVTFTITLSGPSSRPVTVHWCTSNGTARSGSDYVAASGTVTFAPGQTVKTVTVWVKGDRTRESTETFHVRLSRPTGATVADGDALGRIVNDD